MTDENEPREALPYVMPLQYFMALQSSDLHSFAYRVQGCLRDGWIVTASGANAVPNAGLVHWAHLNRYGAPEEKEKPENAEVEE